MTDATWLTAQAINKAKISKETRNVKRRYLNRVRKGAALLDKRVLGWADMIDLDVFQIDDGRYCVLGQTFMDHNGLYENGYAKGSDVLKLNWGEADPSEHKLYTWQFGFNVNVEEINYSELDEGRHWDILAEYWIKEIRARQGRG